MPHQDECGDNCLIQSGLLLLGHAVANRALSQPGLASRPWNKAYGSEAGVDAGALGKNGVPTPKTSHPQLGLCVMMMMMMMKVPTLDSTCANSKWARCRSLATVQ